MRAGLDAAYPPHPLSRELYLGLGPAGALGDEGDGGAAPVVPDDMMTSATRLSFGSISKTSLLSSFANCISLAAGIWLVTAAGS